MEAAHGISRRLLEALILRTIIACLGVVAAGVALGQDFAVTRVATGLIEPVFLTAPPGDNGRVFVVEQHTGQIRILRRNTWTLDATPFLTVPGLSQGEEQGLLGLAFHPNYATNGFFYVYLTDPDSRIRRYRVSANPDVADAASGVQVLSFAQPQANHNGGWIAFGIDGYLHIASGDGGNGDDFGPGHTVGTGNAQDITSNRLG